MKTQEQIKQLLGLMIKTYQTGGTALDGIEMPSDAFECAETLRWVLGEPSGIDELLDHAGVKLPASAPPDLLLTDEKPTQEQIASMAGLYANIMNQAVPQDHVPEGRQIELFDVKWAWNIYRQAQLAHSQPLIEQKVRREIGEALEVSWNKTVPTYEAKVNWFYKIIARLVSGEPLEGGKG